MEEEDGWKLFALKNSSPDILLSPVCSQVVPKKVGAVAWDGMDSTAREVLVVADCSFLGTNWRWS